MLHEFLSSNRADLIERCRIKALGRAGPDLAKLEHGVPALIDQLCSSLREEQTVLAPRPGPGKTTAGPSQKQKLATAQIGNSAMQHGRDLLQQGFTVDQVVHGYGDLCQAISEKALEVRAPIEVDEFKTLNRCLDDAIAGAVTAYSDQRDSVKPYAGAQAMNERLGILAHEQRNLLNKATLALTAIKAGHAPINGATGALLDRSLQGMRLLIDRSLADVRIEAGLPERLQHVSLENFISDVSISASEEARARGCKFSIAQIDPGLAVEADPEMLFSAVGNLLQNAFKFTQAHTEVSLKAYAHGEHVRIDIVDHCGGLPPDAKEKMFKPFAQFSPDKSGLGLGLPIVRRSVEANKGTLSVRDVPGTGCIFTIELPRHTLQ